MLIGGKKFDLRLYALVTSYSPLQVYIYRNGFARFSSFRYNSNVKNIGDSYVHLTNASVQKTAPGFDKAAGCKWGLRNLKLYLIGKYGAARTDQLFREIEEVTNPSPSPSPSPNPSPSPSPYPNPNPDPHQVVIYSLLSVQKVMINDKHCFEMYDHLS
eukprot:scaffold119047_cov24-Phaeocystis_antarctica.AAC.1